MASVIKLLVPSPTYKMWIKPQVGGMMAQALVLVIIPNTREMIGGRLILIGLIRLNKFRYP